MTYSDHQKALKQLKAKPAIMRKYLKHNSPKERSCGRATKKCVITGRVGGHISSYGINLCRQEFRKSAAKLGFKKYN